MSKSMRDIILSREVGDEDRERARKLLQETPLPSGTVLLAGGMKTGTSWMQHILHGLRSNGSMVFENINDEVPILEVVYLVGQDPFANQQFQPYLAKSHGVFDICPCAEKQIVLTRCPADAVHSFYHFLVGYTFSNEELDMDGFVRVFVAEYGEDNYPTLNATQMRHLASWYPHRHDENVLWLHYEDLKADLTQCIKLISDFTGMGVGNQELLDLVERQASVDFMREHQSKFDHTRMRKFIQKHKRQPHTSNEEFNAAVLVRNGKTNESKEAFSPEAKAIMKQKWMELVKPVTGYDSYEELRAAVNREMGRSFPA